MARLGRPPHKPDEASRALVHKLSGLGTPRSDIAKELGIGRTTLHNYYSEELTGGVTAANSAIAESLFNKAKGDGPQAVAACIFWLKTRARWKEVSILEHRTFRDEAVARVFEVIERRVLPVDRKLMDQIAEDLEGLLEEEGDGSEAAAQNVAFDLQKQLASMDASVPADEEPKTNGTNGTNGADGAKKNGRNGNGSGK